MGGRESGEGQCRKDAKFASERYPGLTAIVSTPNNFLISFGI